MIVEFQSTDYVFVQLSAFPELSAAFERVLRSGHFILGSEVDAFERECAAFLGASDADRPRWSSRPRTPTEDTAAGWRGGQCGNE